MSKFESSFIKAIVRTHHTGYILNKHIDNKTILTMRWKSPLSKHVLEKIKSKNSFGFSKGFVKGDNFIVKILFCFISSRFFHKKGKTQKKNKSIYYFINI